MPNGNDRGNTAAGGYTEDDISPRLWIAWGESEVVWG